MTTPTEIAAQNESLKAASKLLFGAGMELRIVNPKTLTLLKENARYFKKATFQQLTENIKTDQRLSSVPLCLQDGETLEVLSGNHRTQAAILAGIEWILVMVITENMDQSRKVATQLSHNALTGEDDKQILANLWAQIEDISTKCYAGLSSETVGELQKLKLTNFSTPALRTKQITFAFTELEHQAITEILEELQEAKGNTIYLADRANFDEFFQAITRTKKKLEIKNGALAMLRIIEAASAIATTREQA